MTVLACRGEAEAGRQYEGEEFGLGKRLVGCLTHWVKVALAPNKERVRTLLALPICGDCGARDALDRRVWLVPVEHAQVAHFARSGLALSSEQSGSYGAVTTKVTRLTSAGTWLSTQICRAQVPRGRSTANRPDSSLPTFTPPSLM